MSHFHTDLPYRPCVGIVLFNKENKVFVGKRFDTPGGWQMPQGGIDEGEDVIHAAKRELEEETGIKQADIIRMAEHTICYDVPVDLSTKHWEGKYRGQEQTWVAMRFTGQDSDICLDSHDTPEFSQWQWIDFHRTVDLIVPFKRDTYSKVIHLFQDILG